MPICWHQHQFNIDLFNARFTTMCGPRQPQTKKQRRRRKHSDWLVALQQTRTARSIREVLPTPTLLRADQLPTPLPYQGPQVAGDQEFPRSDTPEHYTQENTHHSGAELAECSTPSIRYTPTTAQLENDRSTETNDLSSLSEDTGEEPDVLPQPCAGQVTGIPLFVQNGVDGAQTVDLELLQERMKMWENVHSLSALIAIVGSVRYTVEQYEHTRSVLRDVAHGADIWPPYGRIQRCFKYTMKSCMPQSKIVHLPKKKMESVLENERDSLNTQGSQNRAVSENERDADHTEAVRIFLPSAWARMDVATLPTFANMFSRTRAQDTQLEAAQIVQDRAAIAATPRFFFADCNGEKVSCFPESLVTIYAQGCAPNCETPLRILHGEGKYHFDAIVAATWGIGSASNRTPSFKTCLQSDKLTAFEKNIISCTSTSETQFRDEGNKFLPGDICTLLKAKTHNAHDVFVPIIIHRFWRCEVGMPSVFIYWVKLVQSEAASVEQPNNFRLQIPETHIVSKIDLRRQGKNPQQSIAPKVCGILADGTPYVIYRMMLYCDDFQKSSYSSSGGSVGGCYLMPLALPPEERRSVSSVRLISLTPPGVSTNEVLQYIADDIVQGTIHGVDVYRPNGKKVRIFLDLVGFIGDYPASSSVIDVVGHVGRAPCTLCTFRRLHASETEGSRYGYTTTVHANNPAFLRNADRHWALRQSDISDRDGKILGLMGKHRAFLNKSPLMEIHLKLQQSLSFIPQTTEGLPVVPGLLDPYRCNFIAPDHLLTGLSKDILNTVFDCLPTKLLQQKADIMVCAALRQNGLLPQREVFNSRSKSVNSMTLSELYCVLLVSGPVFRILTSKCPPESTVHEAVKLLTHLHRLIALTYWWPKRNMDGEAAVELVHMNKSRYFSELKQLSKGYVCAVNEFCIKSEEGKARLDKPNLHRLLELYEHSIPVFGHIREFMELIFESAHQPLKSSIAGSNNHEAHIFAMEQCVGNDWQGRLASLSRELGHTDSLRRSEAKRGIRRLMLGPQADLLNDERDHEFIKETDHKLANLFTTAVQRYFRKDNMISNFAVEKRSVWKAVGKASTSLLSRSLGINGQMMHGIVTLATRWIDALFPVLFVYDEDKPKQDLKLFKSCKRLKITDSGRQLRGSNGFHKLFPNSVLQIYLQPGNKNARLLKFEDSPGLKPVFFVFLAALHREGDHVWAICLRCSVHEDTIRAIGDLDKDSFQIVCLTDEVTRVAVYHVCQDSSSPMNCNIDIASRTIVHSSSPTEGARMYFQRRLNGYPPRVA